MVIHETETDVAFHGKNPELQHGSNGLAYGGKIQLIV
jgi:hypothetical protein